MITFCGIELAHPVINASGTFDAIAARRAFGDALLEHFPFAAFVSKTVTLAPRQGNPPPRLWELPAGLMNSIGLPNKGLEGYLAHDLPELAQLPVPLIVNVMGFSRDEVARLVTAFAQRDEVAALELNVSCPNVETGLIMGADPDEVARLMSVVRPLTDKPLIVKLTPNASDVPAVAMAAEREGASAVSLINTIRGMAVHPTHRGAVAGGDDRRGLGAGGASDRARSGTVGDRCRRHPGHRDGRGRARPPRPRSDRCRGHACGSRHGELSGPVGGRADRHRVSARSRRSPTIPGGGWRGSGGDSDHPV